MSTVKSPVPQFFDTDGGPLNAGFLYLGTSGQNPETNPITVYWDSALTQPAAQPLRTLNGYISRSGTPAQVFAAVTDYSITVRNNRSELVLTSLSFNPLVEFQADLAAAIHAAPLIADPSELDEIGVWDHLTGLLRKITFSFLQSGVGAVLMTVRRALRLSIWVEHYGGGIAATPAVNNAAFTAAIAEAFARGGDIVNFGPGRWNISAVINLKAGVFLLGRGSTVSEIFLANGSNCDMLNTEGFAAQTLQNLWLISEGVLTGFGFDGIRFNGNRANQIAGNGVRIYGKRYRIGWDVQIIEAKDVGFYSECAGKGGEVAPEDQPEGYLGKIQVWKSGKENIIYRGPHDQPIGDMYSALAGQDGVYDGVVFDSKTDIYMGITYVNGTVHSYASSGHGVVCRSQMMLNKVSGESNYKSGLVFETAGVDWVGAYFLNVNYLEAYHNDVNGTGLYWNLENRAVGVTIGNVRFSTSTICAGSIYNTGGNLSIACGTVIAAGAVVAHGVAFKNNAQHANVNLQILSWNDPTDVAFESVDSAYCHFNFNIYNCLGTAWKNSGTSLANKYTIHASSASGTAFTNTGTQAGTDTFDVKIVIGGVSKLSKYNDVQRSITVGNTVATITHNAFKTPTPGQISITRSGDWNSVVTDSAAATHSQPRGMYVNNITATTFDLVTDVAAPAPGLLFYWKLDM